MQIYLLDIDNRMTALWKIYFDAVENVHVVCDDFKHFMDTYSVDCVVSPANSYGIMDGGYDLAITEYFGKQLMERVQKYIIENCYGEQPVGTSISLDTRIDNIKLIHTPSMRVPSNIKDPMVVYFCMRTCLMEALKQGVKSIVIPAFGGGCGRVPGQVIAKLMYEAYMQVMNPPKELDWNYALRWEPERKGI